MADASILPNEPTMQLKDEPVNEFNKTIKTYKENIIESVTTQLSEVSQVLSKCQMLIGPFNNMEALLPFCSDILSEMKDLVQSVSDKKNQASDSILPSVSSSSVDSSFDSSSESKPVDDLFVYKMSSFIDKIAPNSTFNKRKSKKLRKKRLMMKVPRVLRAIWQNCDKLFCQAPGPGPKQFNHQPTISVDWSKVNIRALTNLPKPQDIPLYGCSANPNKYNYWREMNCPFGSIPGFNTSLGVITLDSIKEPIHGFVYDKSAGG